MTATVILPGQAARAEVGEALGMTLCACGHPAAYHAPGCIGCACAEYDPQPNPKKKEKHHVHA